MNEKFFDVIGVGAGPFNLSLAALLVESSLKHIFFDSKKYYEWHPGMQIDFATIQNNSLRDLVSLVKPDSYYSFNNFLKVNSRLERHMIAGFTATYRWEFEQYLKWVIDSLNTVQLNSEVSNIKQIKGGFEVTVNQSNISTKYLTKNVSLGMGVTPNVPNHFEKFLSNQVFHNSSYKFVNPELFRDKVVTIIGAGQSGLEISLDLLSENTNSPRKITLINRQPFIQQIEDSHFAEEAVFTEMGLNEYFDLDDSQKEILLTKYKLTSDGASPETIKELFQKTYINKYYHNDKTNFNILNNTTVLDINHQEDGSYKLYLQESIGKSKSNLDGDIVILCTGYKQYFPKNLFNSDLLNNIELNKKGLPYISRDYKVKFNGEGNIYIVNGAKHTHGVVDPNLSLSAIRAQAIINNILHQSGKL